MAKNRGTKIYTVGDKLMVFDRERFNDLIRLRIQRDKGRIGQLEQMIAEAVFAGRDAVHSWRMGQSAPGDFQRVADLARYFGVSTENLLKEDECPMSQTCTDRQAEAFRRIYVAVVEYLDDFQRSMGFNAYWFDLADSGVKPEQVETRLYELCDERQHSVMLTAKKEAFDLRGLPLYDEFLDYINDDLVDIYNGKLSYAYRFEAPVEMKDGSLSGVRVEDDYDAAMVKLNRMVEKISVT